MALIECPKCKAKVSDKAYDCPKCGHQFAPGSKKTNVYLLPAVIVVGCLGIFFVYKVFFSGNTSANKMQRLTEERRGQFKAHEEQRQKVADVDTETANHDVDMKRIEQENVVNLEKERIALELEQTKKLLELASEQQVQKRELDARRLQAEQEKLRQEEANKLLQEELERKEEANRIEKSVSEGDILHLDEVTTQPMQLRGGPPTIPESLRNSYLGKKLTILSSILIDEKGNVAAIKILNGGTPADIKSLIENALKEWKYSPAEKDGIKVKVWRTVPITLRF